MSSRERLRRPRGIDVIVGIVYAIFAIAAFVALPILSAGDPDPDVHLSVEPGSLRWWLVIVGLIMQGVALMWGPRLPRMILVIVAAVVLALALATPGAAFSVVSLAVMVSVFRGIVAAGIARMGVSLVAAGVLVALGETINSIWGEVTPPVPAIAGALVQALTVIGIPLFLGLLLKSRNDLRDARHDEQRARTEQRDAQVLAAVSRERTAMARELHDIAAHHLSGIALMAAVVDRQIDTAPEEAHRGVQQVRAQSTAVLDDLRRLVGLLRDDGEAEGERSVQTLAAVPELVESARARGSIQLSILTAEGRVLGTGIGPLSQLALYRTIQEALTNAATHAPGAARVVEVDDRDDTHAVVTITNDPAARPGTTSSTGGFGLIGMRERAELVGANLHYGPTMENGWQVRVVVPRESGSRSASVLTETDPDGARA